MGNYFVSVVRVPQPPIYNQNDIVVVLDLDTKRCLCTNKYKSQHKNEEHAIEMLKNGDAILKLHGDEFD